MALKKRKSSLTELFPEREAIRVQPIKRDPRIQDFIDVQKNKKSKYEIVKNR